MSVWDNPEKQRIFLTGIWKGKKTAQIGKDAGVSKNAVVGHLDRTRALVPQQLVELFGCTLEHAREKLANHAKRRGWENSQSQKAGAKASHQGKMMPAEVFPQRKGSYQVPDLDESECPWPIGHPGQKDFRFCGATKPKRKTYCDEHESQARVGKSKPKLSEDAYAHL